MLASNTMQKDWDVDGFWDDVIRDRNEFQDQETSRLIDAAITSFGTSCPIERVRPDYTIEIARPDSLEGLRQEPVKLRWMNPGIPHSTESYEPFWVEIASNGIEGNKRYYSRY